MGHSKETVRCTLVVMALGLKSLSVLNNCHINITTEINFQTRIVSLKRIEMCITLFSVPIEWEDD